MSVYTIRNIVTKFIDSNIRVLYARPKNIAHKDITGLSQKNILIYDITEISDLSWFTYDILLTHQLNNQILELAYSMHLPIVCYEIDGIPDNYTKDTLNCTYITKNTEISMLIPVFQSLKYQRFIL